MKGKKKDGVILLNYDGRTIEISAEALQETIQKAKFKPDVEEICLRFNIKGEMLDIPVRISDMKKAIKQAILVKKLVPNSLTEYLEDITQKLMMKPIMPIAKREHELEKVWFYISQKVRNNVFLTGEIDVGKTAIAHEIARQISTNECPKEFYKKRVLLLRPEKLLNIKKERAYKNAINKVMNFLVENRKNIVLYIDNGLYMKTDEFLIIMLYACIKKYHIPMIVTLNSEDYDRYFMEDTSISKYLNEVYIIEPEKDELRPIIDAHLKILENRYKVKITEDVVKFGIYTAPLSKSPSCEPGNVINIFEKAFLEARRKGKKYVDKQCILSCYNTYLKDYENTPEKEKRATAYHEIGHYMLYVKSDTQQDIKISCVSSLPMVDWSGVTMPYIDNKEFVVYSKEYFIDRIAVSLAGRVAERRIIGTISTGASIDLEHVNIFAKQAVMKLGFSDKDENRNRSYDYEDFYFMPESKKELIDKEIQELIDEGMRRAEKVINDNEGLLEVLAERLLVDEILTGEELEQICKEYEEGVTLKEVKEKAETPKETE